MARSRYRRSMRGLGDPGKKKERGFATVGLLGLLGAGTALAIYFGTRGRRPSPAPSPVIPEFGADAYTVKAGDSLTAIVRSLLGEQYLAMWVYDLNREIIGDNINLIHPGQILQIPTRASVNAAPGREIESFRPRFAALDATYRRACTAGSYPYGTGRRNCGQNAIIEVGPDVSAPTVLPSSEPSASGSRFQYAQGFRGMSGISADRLGQWRPESGRHWARASRQETLAYLADMGTVNVKA
mgnify:CR=1 FL=1